MQVPWNRTLLSSNYRQYEEVYNKNNMVPQEIHFSCSLNTVLLKHYHNICLQLHQLPNYHFGLDPQRDLAITTPSMTAFSCLEKSQEQTVIHKSELGAQAPYKMKGER